ncbi:MAG: NnrU family protein [Pseudomonadota bacterium]
MNVVVAMAVFVLSHVAISRTQVKPLLIAKIGQRGYLALYSILSVVLLAWVIGAVITAERITIWPAPVWAYPFAVLVSLAGFILIGIGTVVPNPLSVSFRTAGFDPIRPGVIAWIRHPLIWGLSLWALAHVPANGEWPSLILFAGSALFGGIGVLAIERRKKRQMGEGEWEKLTAGRGQWNRAALAGAVAGIMMWFVLLMLHPVLFGVAPLDFII